MKKHLRLCTVLLSISISSGLFSCSKKEIDIEPSIQSDTQVTLSDEVKLVDGRLVFPDHTTFNRISADLEKLYHSPQGSQPLTAWEQNLHFTSLRRAALVEESHLEQLDTQGQLAPAHELLTSFGFPLTYATIINPVGEYQIGKSIYWFHKGFKYEANSEEELATIKQNPANARRKGIAGFRIMHDQKFVVLDSSKNTSNQRFIQSGDPYAFDKYTYLFDYEYSSSSHRRIVFATHVYVENTLQGNNVDYFSTNIYLLLKFQFYSFGRKAWYPVVGEGYRYNIDINFSGKTTIPQQVGSSTVRAAHYAVSSDPFTPPNTDGMYTLLLAGDLLASEYDYLTPRRNIYEVNWDFEITGFVGAYTAFSNSGSFGVGTYGGNTVLW